MLSIEEMARVLGSKALGESETRKISKFVIHSKDAEKGSCFIGIKGERFDGNDFASDAWERGCRVFVLDRKKIKENPNLPNSVIFAVSDTVEALGLLAREYRRSAFIQSLAITGSSGKTTTRRLLSLFLAQKFKIFTARKNLNNEIGLPLTILETPPDSYLVLLEMGMNHAGEIEYLSRIAEPLVALITNIGYAHIGNLGSLEAIADAKSEVFKGMNAHAFVFLNRNDPFFDYLRKKSPVEVREFSWQDLEIVENRGIDGYRLKYKGMEFDFPLPGRHHLEDLAAACAVAEFYGILPRQIVQAMKNFQAVEGRAEVLKGSFTLINDCYNANPSSMRASLEILKHSGKGRKVAILSDMLELGKFALREHQELAEWIIREKAADRVLAYGKQSKNLIAVLQSAGLGAEYFENMESLIEGAKKEVQNGDFVLVKASRGMHLEEVVKVLSPF